MTNIYIHMYNIIDVINSRGVYSLKTCSSFSSINPDALGCRLPCCVLQIDVASFSGSAAVGFSPLNSSG